VEHQPSGTSYVSDEQKKVKAEIFALINKYLTLVFSFPDLKCLKGEDYAMAIEMSTKILKKQVNVYIDNQCESLTETARNLLSF